MDAIINFSDFATSTILCLSIANFPFFIYYQCNFKHKAIFSQKKKCYITLFGVFFGFFYFFIIPPTTNTIFSIYFHPLLIFLNFFLVAQYTDAIGSKSFYKSGWKGERSTIKFSKIIKAELEKNEDYFIILVHDSFGITEFKFLNKDEEKILLYLKSKKLKITEK